MEVTYEIDEHGNVRKSDGALTIVIGTSPKTETVVLDEDNVEDVTYEFNLESGQYNEISRVPRNIRWDDESGQFNLQKYKEDKIGILSGISALNLQAGFTSTVEREGVNLEFSYDSTAQMRFTKQSALIANNPDMTDIQWLTKNAGFVILTRAEFISVTNTAAQHEINNEFKFLYAEAGILNATSKEDVDTIVEAF